MRPADGLERVVEPQAKVDIGKGETVDILAVEVARARVAAVGVEARKVAGRRRARCADLEALVFLCEADGCSAACGLVGAVGEDGARLSRRYTTAWGWLWLLAVAGRGQRGCSLYG